MATLESEFLDPLVEMKAHMGSSWKAGAVTFTAIHDDQTAGNDLVDGGFLGDDAFFLTAVIADLTGGIPSIGSLIENLATTSSYKVLKTVTSEGDPAVRLVMGNTNKH